MKISPHSVPLGKISPQIGFGGFRGQVEYVTKGVEHNEGLVHVTGWYHGADCERACVMPVHVAPAGSNGPVPFIVCEKRSDIERVPVSIERLTQWRCDADSVCRFIATSLGLRRSNERLSNAAVWNIGIARGDKRRQLLCLQVDGGLDLIVGNSRVPLAELVGFCGGQYSLDAAAIRELVDSATTADQRYTSSNVRREARKLNTQAMYERWQKAYRSSKKQRPSRSDVWHSQQIAKLEVAEDRDAETIRKHMKG